MKRLFLPFLIFISNITFAIAGVIVLGGGGAEGDIGVTTDWSYTLYKSLIDNGDVNGDRKIKIVVLSLEKPDTNFIVDYFKSMGATISENLVVKSRKDADNLKLISTLLDADALFIRGGNQANAYSFWKNTKLHALIQALMLRGGSIGGTSSGAMSLSQYSMTGGYDYNSKEILEDGQSPLLNDVKRPRSTGIHNDFLRIIPGVIVDTHCGERGRIGRIMGVLAKATSDYQDKNILAICLEEQTGLLISKNTARVYGVNAVHFLQETVETRSIRERGKPLIYTDVRDDMLTDGWEYDLESKRPNLQKLPQGAQAFQSFASNELHVSYDAFTEKLLKTGDEERGLTQTLSFKKLSDKPGSSVVLMGVSSELRVTDDNELFTIKKIGYVPKRKDSAILVFDCQYCTHRSLSTTLSVQDFGSKTLYTPGLVNMRISTVAGMATYDLKNHRVEIGSQAQSIDKIACKNGRILQGFEMVRGRPKNVGKEGCR